MIECTNGWWFSPLGFTRHSASHSSPPLCHLCPPYVGKSERSGRASVLPVFRCPRAGARRPLCLVLSCLALSYRHMATARGVDGEAWGLIYREPLGCVGRELMSPPTRTVPRWTCTKKKRHPRRTYLGPLGSLVSDPFGVSGAARSSTPALAALGALGSKMHITYSYNFSERKAGIMVGG